VPRASPARRSSWTCGRMRSSWSYASATRTESANSLPLGVFELGDSAARRTGSPARSRPFPTCSVKVP
jgi:hypothetical protein